jgi:hypothetical protein
MTKNMIPLDVKQHKTRLYPLSPSLFHTFQKPCFLVKFPYKTTPILLLPTPFLALNDIQIPCHSSTNVPFLYTQYPQRGKENKSESAYKNVPNLGNKHA